MRLIFYNRSNVFYFITDLYSNDYYHYYYYSLWFHHNSDTWWYFTLLLLLSFTFTRALAGGFSMESEWQNIFSGLLDFYQYSERFKQYYSRDGLDSLQFLQCPFQVHQLQFISSSPSCSTAFLVLWQGLSIYLLFSSCSRPERQNRLNGKLFFFLLINTWSCLLGGIKWSICISKPMRRRILLLL